MATPGFNIQKENVNKPQFQAYRQLESYGQMRRDLNRRLKDAATYGDTIAAQTARNRKYRDALQKEEEKELDTQYARIGDIGDTGFSKLDKSKDDYFYALIDDYVDIKRAMEGPSPTVDQQTGRRALAEINQKVDRFKGAVPEIMAQAQLVNEALKIPAGKPGSLSSLFSSEEAQVLRNLVNDGDVSILEKNGQLVLFSPPGSTNLPEGGLINVDELQKLTEQGKNYVQTVPDVGGQLKNAFEGIVGNKENGYNLGYTIDPTTGKTRVDDEGNPIGRFFTENTFTENNKTITTRTMTSQQRDNIQDAMLKTNIMQPIVDTYGREIWADMMGNDTPYEPNKNSDEVVRFLTNKAIDDYGDEVGIEYITDTKDKEKEKAREADKKAYRERKKALKEMKLSKDELTQEVDFMFKGLMNLDSQNLLNMKLFDVLMEDIKFTKDGKMQMAGGDLAPFDITDREAIVNLFRENFPKIPVKDVTKIVDDWYEDHPGYEATWKDILKEKIESGTLEMVEEEVKEEGELD